MNRHRRSGFPSSTRFAAILVLVQIGISALGIDDDVLTDPAGWVAIGWLAGLAGLSILVVRESARAADVLAVSLCAAIAWQAWILRSAIGILLGTAVLHSVMSDWLIVIAIVCLGIGRSAAWSTQRATEQRRSSRRRSHGSPHRRMRRRVGLTGSPRDLKDA